MSKVSRKNNTQINYHPHSFRKWINVFFVTFLLGIVFAVSFIYFYSENFILEDLHFRSDSSKHTATDLFNQVRLIRRGFIFLSVIMLIGIIWIWYYIHKWIMFPLNQMVVAVEKIGRGHLNQTIKIDAPEEIQRISESINDLSVNLQEVLLFVWNQTEASLQFLEGAHDENRESNVVNSDKDLKVIAVKKNMLELQKMISAFAFYDVRFDQNRVIDGSKKST